jgi:hypothetical protein
VYGFLIILLFAALAGASHLDAVTIQTVEVQGNQVVPTAQITAKVQDMLGASKGVIFSRKNILFYPSGKIERNLMEAYPRFATVVVHAVTPTKIEVLISERKPKSLWCKATSPSDIAATISMDQSEVNAATATSPYAPETIETGQQCYFIDSQGFIFSLAPNFQGNAYTKFFGGSIGPQPIGQALMSSTTYAQIINLADALDAQGLKISYITVKDAHTFNIKLLGNGEIYFSDQKSLEDSLNNLIAALGSEVFVGKQGKASVGSSTQPRSLAQFVYIDMRFGNKVFFKLKGQASTTTPATTTLQ